MKAFIVRLQIWLLRKKAIICNGYIHPTHHHIILLGPWVHAHMWSISNLLVVCPATLANLRNMKIIMETKSISWMRIYALATN